MTQNKKMLAGPRIAHLPLELSSNDLVSLFVQNWQTTPSCTRIEDSLAQVQKIQGSLLDFDGSFARCLNTPRVGCRLHRAGDQLSIGMKTRCSPRHGPCRPRLASSLQRSPVPSHPHAQPIKTLVTYRQVFLVLPSSKRSSSYQSLLRQEDQPPSSILQS